MEVHNKGVMGVLIERMIELDGIESLDVETKAYYNKVKDNVGWAHFDEQNNLISGQENNVKIISDFLSKCIH